MDVKEINTEEEDFDLTFYVIGLVVFLALFCIMNKEKGGSKSPQRPKDDRTTEWSRSEIRKYSGPPKTLIALNGFVFDVTESPNFKEGGMYEKFAGRDITMACAHYSTDEVYLDKEYKEGETQLTFD